MWLDQSINWSASIELFESEWTPNQWWWLNNSHCKMSDLFVKTFMTIWIEQWFLHFLCVCVCELTIEETKQKKKRAMMKDIYICLLPSWLINTFHKWTRLFCFHLLYCNIFYHQNHIWCVSSYLLLQLFYTIFFKSKLWITLVIIIYKSF